MSPPDDSQQITIYLRRLSKGDSSAEDPLAELVYAQIQKMARRLVRDNAADLSLQATSLVNTVLLELVRVRTIDWEDRGHFFRIASRLLRRRLIDYIRAQRAAKRLLHGSRRSQRRPRVQRFASGQRAETYHDAPGGRPS